MTINYIVSSVITTAGIQAALNAGQNGPYIDITGFRIGSESAADGYVALATATDVGGFVYEGSSAQLAYNVVDQDTVIFTIGLDTTVGNFQIGNIALTIANTNTPFCIAVYPTQTSKYLSDPPTVVGNILYYKILMRLANVASLLNVTIIESDTASLPEVPTELQLPDAFSSPYNCYMVDNHTHLGTPTTALRLNGQWYHSAHYESAGMNDTILPVTSAMFDSTVPLSTFPTSAASAVVGYHTQTNKFYKMDNVDVDGVLFCVGVRCSSFQIVTRGLIQIDTTLLGTLTTGTVYYAGTGATAGQLTSTPNIFPVGIAVSSNYLWVDLEAFQNVYGNICLQAVPLSNPPTTSTWILGCDTSNNLIKFTIAQLLTLISESTGTGSTGATATGATATGATGSTGITGTGSTSSVGGSFGDATGMVSGG